MSDEKPASRKEELELRKIELENIKLEKEIRKSWFKRLFTNVNIIQVLTVLIVISGAIAAYRTNYFQNQNTLLEIRKALLNNEIDNLKIEVEKIKQINTQLQNKSNELELEKNTLRSDILNLERAKKSLETRIFELKDTISFMLRTDAFIRKSAKRKLEFSMEFIGNNIDTTKLTSKEMQIIRDEIYLSYLQIGSFEKRNSENGNRIQEWAEKFLKAQEENDSLKEVISKYRRLFNE